MDFILEHVIFGSFVCIKGWIALFRLDMLGDAEHPWRKSSSPQMHAFEAENCAAGDTLKIL